MEAVGQRSVAELGKSFLFKLFVTDRATFYGFLGTKERCRQPHQSSQQTQFFASKFSSYMCVSTSLSNHHISHPCDCSELVRCWQWTKRVPGFLEYCRNWGRNWASEASWGGFVPKKHLPQGMILSLLYAESKLQCCLYLSGLVSCNIVGSVYNSLGDVL